MDFERWVSYFRDHVHIRLWMRTINSARVHPHLWRSLQLRRDSVTKEDCAAAMQAWHDNPPGPESNFEFQENSDRTKSLFKSYFEERHQWPRETGRQLPSLEERRILHAKQYRRSGNR